MISYKIFIVDRMLLMHYREDFHLQGCLANLKQKYWNTIYKFQPDIDVCGDCMYINMGDIWLYDSHIELLHTEYGSTDSISFETNAPDADFPFGWIRHAIAEL